MDPAGSAQQGCKKLAQKLKKLLQREQVLVQLQKDLFRQPAIVARQPVWVTEQLPPAAPHLPVEPQRYNGNVGGCRAFLTQCNWALKFQPITSLTDRSRIAYIILLLSGKA